MSSLSFFIGLSLIYLINCASISQSNVVDRLGFPSGNDLTPLSSSSNADPLGDLALNSPSSSLIGRSSLSSGSSTDSKKQDPLGDFAIRSALSHRSVSTPAPTSLSPLSSLSPSRLIPMISSATSRVTSALPVHAFAMRPINRLLDLLPRYDYDDSALTGRNTISSPGSRIPDFHGERRQDQFNSFPNGNGLTSLNANDPLPDLMKQGTVAKAPWLPNRFQGTNQQNNNRRSTLRNIVNRIFG